MKQTNNYIEFNDNNIMIQYNLRIKIIWSNLFEILKNIKNFDFNINTIGYKL